MNWNLKKRPLGLLLVTCFTLLSCSGRGPATEDHDHDHEAKSAPTNRLTLTNEIINNLGLTFEAARRGRFQVWRSLSGELEVPEDRQFVLKAPALGRVISVAKRGHVVAHDEVIAQLEVPELKELQVNVDSAQRTTVRLKGALAELEKLERETRAYALEAEQFQAEARQRVEELSKLMKEGNALVVKDLLEARVTLTEASRAHLEAKEKQADHLAQRRQLEHDLADAFAAVDARLVELTLLTGLRRERLMATEGGVPAYRMLKHVEIRSPSVGMVTEPLAQVRDLVDAGDPVLKVVDASSLRFRGALPESDAALVVAGRTLRIEFPSKAWSPVEVPLTQALPIADRHTRMVPVEALLRNPEHKMQDGLSATASLLGEGGAHEEVLLPMPCVLFDGLDAVVFRRDPNDANVVIRTKVELGQRNAREAEILAGLMAGDQVVALGVQQMMQALSAKPKESGHFHADGTFHADGK